MATSQGWNKTDPDRPVQVVDDCLVTQTISGEITFPSKAVLVCKFMECGARSDDVGQLPCKRIPGG